METIDLSNEATLLFMALMNRFGAEAANDILSTVNSGLMFETDKKTFFSGKYTPMSVSIRDNALLSPTECNNLIKATLGEDYVNGDKENTLTFEEKMAKAISVIQNSLNSISDQEYKIFEKMTVAEMSKGEIFGYSNGSIAIRNEVAGYFNLDPTCTTEELCKSIKSSVESDTKEKLRSEETDNVSRRIMTAAKVTWGKDKAGDPYIPTPEEIGKRFAFHRSNSQNVAALQKSVDTLREQQDNLTGRLQSSLRKMLPSSLYNTLSALDRQIHSPYSSTSLHPQVERHLAVAVDGMSAEQRKETAEGVVETERLLLGDWKQGHEKLDRLSSILVEKSQEAQSEEQSQEQGKGLGV